MPRSQEKSQLVLDGLDLSFPVKVLDLLHRKAKVYRQLFDLLMRFAVVNLLSGGLLVESNRNVQVDDSLGSCGVYTQFCFSYQDLCDFEVQVPKTVHSGELIHLLKELEEEQRTEPGIPELVCSLDAQIIEFRLVDGLQIPLDKRLGFRDNPDISSVLEVHLLRHSSLINQFDVKHE